jgi:tetratricopeptide (TPR) repeat protein
LALRREGRDAEALELFERSFRMAPSPIPLAQIAMAEQALGRWVIANEHLEAALAEEDNGWIRRNQRLLRGSLRQIRRNLGQLELVGGLEGVEVAVNGKEVGTLPIDTMIWVEAGTAQVVARHESILPYRREVNITAGETARLELNLVEGEGGDGLRRIPIPIAPPEDVAEQVFWAFAIPAVALGIAAIGTGSATVVAQQDYQQCQEVSCIDEQLSLGRTLAFATNVLLASAGAFAAGALIVYLVDPTIFDNEEPEQQIIEVDLRPRLLPWVSPDTAGLALEGTF